MAANNTVPDKTPGDFHYASEVDEIASFQRTPMQTVGSAFNDSGFTIDGTAGYTTPISIAGATHTITAAASGHNIGNGIQTRYIFAQECALTLANFDLTGSNTGTVDPIPAGTYDLWFLATPLGVQVHIPLNGGAGGSLPTVLTALTLNATTPQNGAVKIDFTNPNSNNENSNLFEYKLDTESNWTVGVQATTGAITITIPNLTNALLYNFRATALGSGSYSNSALSNILSDTPSAGLTQLPIITGLTSQQYRQDQSPLQWAATSGNESQISILRSPTQGSGYLEIDTAATSTVFYVDTTALDGNTYYYKVQEIGDGVTYSDGPLSAERANIVGSDPVSYLGLAGVRAVVDDWYLETNTDNLYGNVAANNDMVSWKTRAGTVTDPFTVSGTAPVLDIVNGYNLGVKFAGAGCLEENADLVGNWNWMISGPGAAWQITIVAKVGIVASPGANYSLIGNNGTSGANSGMSIRYGDATHSDAARLQLTQSGFPDPSKYNDNINDAITPNTYVVLDFVLQDVLGSDQYEVFANNVSQGTISRAFTLLSSYTAIGLPMQIGSVGSDVQYLIGNIRFAMWRSHLSESERSATAIELMTRYDIT